MPNQNTKLPPHTAYSINTQLLLSKNLTHSKSLKQKPQKPRTLIRLLRTMARTQSVPIKQGLTKSTLKNDEFEPIDFKTQSSIVYPDFLADDYIFTEEPFKTLIEEQRLGKLLKIKALVFVKLITEFYANLKIHKKHDILRTTVTGVTVTITPQALQQLLDIKNEGTIFRKDGDWRKATYDPKLWLPEGYEGDKFSTHWPKEPRVLQFLLAKLILIRRGSPNTASSLHHCIIQHWMESKPINWPVLLINFIRNNQHNHGALISVILDAAGVDVMGETGGRGKPIREKTFTSLLCDQEWDAEKYWKQQEAKKGGRKRPAARTPEEEEPAPKQAKMAKKAVAKKPPPPPAEGSDEDGLTITEALRKKNPVETRKRPAALAPRKPVITVAKESVSDKIANLRRKLLNMEESTESDESPVKERKLPPPGRSMDEDIAIRSEE